MRGQGHIISDIKLIIYFNSKFKFRYKNHLQKLYKSQKSGVTILCHEITNHTVIFGPRSQGQNHLHEKL